MFRILTRFTPITRHLSRYYTACPTYQIISIPPQQHVHILPLTVQLGHARGKNLEYVNVTVKVPITETSIQTPPTPTSTSTSTSTQISPPLSPFIRSPSDSWLRLILPFTNETWARTYRLFDTQRVRTGRMFEDLDAFAADIAYRHCGPHALSQLTIVTAGLERASFYHYITLNHDLALTGCVTWTGKSSMEIRVELATVINDTYNTIGHAHFQMVARDKQKYHAVTVPRIVPCNEEEYEIWKQADQQRVIRRSRLAQSLDSTPPNSDETLLIHQLYLMNQKDSLQYISPSSQIHPIVSLPSTAMSSTVLMQGQDRNINNKMFGGHLMRLAYELAWSNAYVVTREQPVFLIIDDVRFVAPVEIGSVVQFLSSVIYTDINTNILVVHVDAQVLDPKTGSHRTTNSFYFCFQHIASRPLVFVMPQSYSDYMRYLDGRRRAMLLSQMENGGGKNQSRITSTSSSSSSSTTSSSTSTSTASTTAASKTSS